MCLTLLEPLHERLIGFIATPLHLHDSPCPMRRRIDVFTSKTMSRVTLWLRAGSDGVQVSGDPAGHHLFMRLLFHARHDASLKFDVKTVNDNRPPQDFKNTGLRKPPGLEVADEEPLQQVDDILNFIDRLQPVYKADMDAEDATADLFSKFAWYIKEVNHDPKSLNTELLRIEKHLEAHESRFLSGDELSHIDCLVLTRLHSIRIAAKELKNYEIPAELKLIWRYLRDGYAEEIFRISCPSDQEIVLHWSDRPDTPSVSPQRRAQLAREQVAFTFSIPH
ncbi:unnamed protein product [Caenorhabditis auriculariae]|uniref:GST C-terminal domain-containing protein n=1 Tax=Caenorhabditis auriculariae TaxID=2777116 RepID=A0A8S1HVA9_9PELO|nr:unnamed protein product [Caenorhabditis auriculariae]